MLLQDPLVYEALLENAWSCSITMYNKTSAVVAVRVLFVTHRYASLISVETPV